MAGATFLRLSDRLICRAGAAFSSGNGTLIGLVFHALVEDASALADDRLFTAQCFTVADFRRAVEHFASRGYRFITPEDDLKLLEPSGRYVMLTFDDGYRNNILALPVLREFGAKAVFYTSTDHVRHGKAFWWDVLWRRRRAAGTAPPAILREMSRLNTRRTEDIERAMLNDFGPGGLEPSGDIDRPFSPAELRQFAGDPLVVLGNHTANHAVLTNYAPEEARARIEACQQALADIAGRAPVSIAWPDGRYNSQVISIARAAGLRVGLTVDLHIERLPLRDDGDRLMRLGRFCFKQDETIDAQCTAMRSPVSIYRLGQKLLRRLRGSPDQTYGRTA